ncbi:unnamed protein product [Cuscuta epithymum]|uniref:Uncharacterized protein n=1 Tax=Cuscuta epithymum TaxID=186058 RepID=A0AAV0GFU4_9ASTE|nr:unnamed protein product [Cuscuta epithymum]
MMQWVEDQISANTSSISKSSICGKMNELPDTIPRVKAALTQTILDPKSSKRKGAPRKNRLKGPLEKGKKTKTVRATKQKGQASSVVEVGHEVGSSSVQYLDLDLNMSLGVL